MRATDSKGANQYDDAFFENIEPEALASARAIVPAVIELISPGSVVDVGCGRGAWLRAFLENGLQDVIGLDGEYVDQSRLLFPRERFKAVNLSKPFSIPGTHDLAVCLEVAEHLPQSAAKGLVLNLTSAAPAVLFSAAVPGQGGTHHINEQWPSYWTRMFRKCGFVALDPLRRKIAADRQVAWWYRQNVRLYVAKSHLAKSRALQAEQKYSETYDLEYLHPDILNRFTSLRGLVAALPGATWRAIVRAASGWDARNEKS